MGFFRYKTDLDPDAVLARFDAFLATERHSPMMPFAAYDNPRVGLHVYRQEGKVRGYYENGIRTRADRLQSVKVWFDMDITPREDGATVSGVVYSSPYFVILGAIMLATAFRVLLEEPLSFWFPLLLSAVFFALEHKDRITVKEQLKALIPPKKSQ